MCFPNKTQSYSCQFPIFIKLEKKNKIAAIYNFVGQLFKEKIKVYGENVMANPWEEIPLSDYEKHMKLGSVMQLQTLNEMMKGQFAAYPVSSIMILGIAGGNGLEHIPRDKFKTIYGVDINNSYLQTVIQRYPELNGHLECLCLNLIDETEKLPKAELLVANLLVEYIGYDCFQKAVKQVQPKYVSCIIQINIDDGWVSDSDRKSVV